MFDIGIRHVGIVDTDLLIDDLIAFVQSNGARTLFGSVDGRIRWIASTHVHDEMYATDRLGNKNKFEKIAGQSADTPWCTTADRVQKVFETRLVDNIRFVDVTDVMIDHPLARAVAEIDPHDERTGRLAALMESAGFLVFSRDKSLRRPALAPADLAPIVAAVHGVAQSDVIGPGTLVVGRVTFGAADLLARSALSRFESPRER